MVIEGKKIITSIAQTLDQKANFPMLGDSPPPKLNARSRANVSDEKQTDANCTHHVATYFANPAILNETLTAKPSAHNLGGTPLITPFEQDDKEMPKTRRSKSVGQFPSTPSKHKVGNGNNKSLPPSKHKSSPLKDMVRKPSKGGKDSSILSDFFLPKGGKAPAARYPLRRAGIPNPTIAGKEPHDVATGVKNQSTDVPMIDLESIINEEEKRINEVILAKEIQIQAEAAQLVRDAGEKWLSQVPDQKRNDIEKFAIQFLLAMDSTLCFFTVSLRMIALAPWKDSMVSIDVRQAAVVAISKGWFVKSDPFNAYPFTRAELALAAGSYLGKITPSLAGDATVALRAIVELLPIACDEFFAQVSLACPFCQAKYLEFRPYPVFQDFFPLLSDTTSLLNDTSILDLGLEVVGLVCSNIAAEDSRHYWLVECSQARPQMAYDSLKGVQKITLELYRSLSVTGLLGSNFFLFATASLRLLHQSRSTRHFWSVAPRPLIPLSGISFRSRGSRGSYILPTRTSGRMITEQLRLVMKEGFGIPARRSQTLEFWHQEVSLSIGCTPSCNLNWLGLSLDPIFSKEADAKVNPNYS